MSVSASSVPSNRLRFAATVIVVCGGSLAAWFVLRSPRLPEGISREEFDSAARRFRDAYRRKPDRLDVLSLAGEVAVKEDRLAAAVSCFREIPSDHSQYGLAARLQEGQVLLRMNRADEAERCFREFLSRAEFRPSIPAEHLIAASNWLSYLLSVELRFEERKSHLAEVHARDQADVFDSKQFFFPNLLLWHSPAGSSRLREFLAETPGDRRLQVANGRYLTAEGKIDDAAALLGRLYQGLPADLDCLAALLECRFERSDWDRLASLGSVLPAYDAGEPWLLTRFRGELALHDKNWDDAVRQFQRVLLKDPANPWSHMGLSRAYDELQRPQKRDEFRRRSLILSKIRLKLSAVKEDRPEAARELAALCDQIEFREAAETFRRHALRIDDALRRSTAGK